jgi:hypothetical protein
VTGRHDLGVQHLDHGSDGGARRQPFHAFEADHLQSAVPGLPGGHPEQPQRRGLIVDQAMPDHRGPQRHLSLGVAAGEAAQGQHLPLGALDEQREPHAVADGRRGG